MLTPPRFLACALLSAALVLGQSAHAGFTLLIQEDGSSVGQVSITGTPGSPITYVGAVGNDFNISTLSVNSNSNVSSVLGSTANLSISATLTEDATATGSHTLSFVVTDTGFQTPGGPNYVISLSTASDSYTFGVSGDTHTFVSNANSTPTTTLSFNMDNPLHGNNSGTSPIMPFTAASLPYTLSNTSVLTFANPATSPNQTGLNFTGITQAMSAVPEPASMVTLGVGLLAVVGLRLRTRKHA